MQKEFYEEEIINDSNEINSINIKGPNFTNIIEQMRKNFLEKENETESEVENKISKISENAYKAAINLKNPFIDTEENQFNTILCLGKVQSGKTTFFISTIALAFDNGYNIAYVLAGTKKKLLEQTSKRMKLSFIDNEKIKVLKLEEVDLAKEYIKSGYKVVFVVLKNTGTKNLELLRKVTLNLFNNQPSIIIDDEGDEATPGAEKTKKNNPKAGKTHDKIVEIIKNIRICSFLSVTATPQANLLISTIDTISPDKLVLVKPGEGYIGGKEFFDTEDNPNVNVISDVDDFTSSIPNSFKKAMYYFLTICAIKQAEGDMGHYSMLVHPSSLNSVQEGVTKKIQRFFDVKISQIKNYKNLDEIERDDFDKDLNGALIEYKKTTDCSIDLEEIKKNIIKVIDNIDIKTINARYNINNEDDLVDEKLYTINIGGNILGRGLTIKKLVVSYIYRDSKESQIDTMYQRCRWFGYKKEYFNMCRVYLTNELQEKFIAIVQHEEEMWNSLTTFLNSTNGNNLKKYKRLFEISHPNLNLTRKTISNTINLKVFTAHSFDRNIDLTSEQKAQNREIYFEYLKKYESVAQAIDFDNSKNHKQRHLLIKTTLEEFYEEFLSRINYGYGSQKDKLYYQKIIKEIKKHNLDSFVTVMLMRYEWGEYRSPSEDKYNQIKALLQGRNNNTNFSGDAYPRDINGKEYSNEKFFQIHMVDTKNNPADLNKCIPMLSHNFPITEHDVRIVTGDNKYE
ncbi:Z1 domain-containing protein [Mycoplasmopsis arginini]|uniref:Z1 domain-containing protein n=1 Tax=Mycoplasmopsis arginini TaxID=2094 RepID=UPI00249E3313|nr:Z1 domain-containing protein [Mycoplasmopsis arginini]MDI3351323.1 hypothetical protein [Mycoplasmopsis arginini]MDI3351853.1 hypothetical protein [Mycoplasmopsis arginini]